MRIKLKDPQKCRLECGRCTTPLEGEDMGERCPECRSWLINARHHDTDQVLLVRDENGGPVGENIEKVAEW